MTTAKLAAVSAIASCAIAVSAQPSYAFPGGAVGICQVGVPSPCNGPGNWFPMPLPGSLADLLAALLGLVS